MPKRMSWGAIGKALGLSGSDDTIEMADDAPVATGSAPAASSGDPVRRESVGDSETERLRSELLAARQREEERIKRDSLSFAALATRQEKVPPYLGNIVALEYEAVALADLDRPLPEGQAILVGETACMTRVEAIREHYAQLPAAGHTRRQVLDRARIVSNGSEGLPSEEDQAREHGRAVARQLNAGK